MPTATHFLLHYAFERHLHANQPIHYSPGEKKKVKPLKQGKEAHSLRKEKKATKKGHENKEPLQMYLLHR